MPTSSPIPITECLSAFVKGKKADPESDGFYKQACFLGWCAELVYPSETEKGERTAESEAQTKYRKSRPWWKCLSNHSKTQQELRDAWYTAAKTLQEKAKIRFAKNLNIDDDHLAYISSFGTQCFVASNDDNIIVCFRGTEPDRFRDILSDLLSWQTKADHSSGQIHVGFNDALGRVWDANAINANTNERGTLRDLLDKKNLLDKTKPKTLRDNDQTVWITGHSLGGALATLAADRLVNEEILLRDDVGGVFTFGQPRVGNGGFTKDYKLKDRHFRFVNNNDIVTRVPPGNVMTIVSLVGALFGSKSKKNGDSEKQPVTKAESEKQSKAKADSGKQWNLVYRDVGDVVHANRSFQLKRLKRGVFWWKVLLFCGRTVSRVRAPFTRGRSFTARFFPGVADHSMTEYNRSLQKRANVIDPDEEKPIAESSAAKDSPSRVDPPRRAPST